MATNDRSKPEAFFPFESHSPSETTAFGARLASRLGPGDVVALYGDLGTGKTHLIKGVCAALGVPEAAVSSPTFALLHEYAGTAFPIYHFDAYRIKTAGEFFDLGYEEYFYGQGLCLIEWPAHVEALLPDHTLRLRLHHLGGDRRRIEGAAREPATLAR
jgi:tRNA threonylcarbamoyladenosine biosynthesis protein TsaE